MQDHNTPLNTTDIDLVKIDRDNARLIFKINNKKAVEEFLANQGLQKFLRSDYDSDPSKRGCRLNITIVDGNLIMGRQLKPTTERLGARLDLARSFAAFIMPRNDGNLGTLADVIIGLTGQEMHRTYETMNRNLVDWENAQPFNLLSTTNNASVSSRPSNR